MYMYIIILNPDTYSKNFISPDVALLRQTLLAHLRDLRSQRRDFQQQTLARVGQVVLHLRENETQTRDVTQTRMEG